MLGQTNKSLLANRLQRKLRSTMTDVERKLWQVLRHGQLSGCKFRRQHPFGNYILDFVCLDTKVVIEVDGSQHQENAIGDEERTLFLEKAGFTVLRFWNSEVIEEIDSVKEKIWLAVQEKSPHPHPSPPLEGEGALTQVGGSMKKE